MNKVIITAMMGLGMLYAQAVSANEMVRYEHGLYVADASDAQSSSPMLSKAGKPVSEKKAGKVAHHGHKHHNRHHHHKHGHKHHHHHKHHRNMGGCPQAGCAESGMYAPRSSMVYQPANLEQMEPNMDIMDRDRPARSGRGR